MPRRNDLLVEKAREQRKLSDAEMDWNNAQAEIRRVLNPTTIERPNDEMWKEYRAADRRLTDAWEGIKAARQKIKAIDKEL